MSDYISREVLMQKFADHVRRSNNSDFAPTPTWNEAVDIVEHFPDADVVERELYQRALSDVVRLSVERPERKHGEWFDATTLDNEFICWVCSECRHGADFVDEPYNFCPNCGADMRGDDDV